MTSGIFGKVDIDLIGKGDRQRETVGDLTGLMTSIAQRGLIHPIVLTRDYTLVAGERRLESCRALGWTHIPFQFVDEADQDELDLIELEENTKRLDLTWEEEHNFHMRKIAIFRRREPNITQTELGRYLGIDQSNIARHILYEEEKDNPVVQKAVENKKTFTSASNAAAKVKKLRITDELLGGDYASRINTHESPILEKDFHEWAPSYAGPKFTIIHCDFPYGINADKHQGQNSQLQAEYDDDPDVYWALLSTLTIYLNRFCAESAHIFFWFSPKHYCKTWDYLQELDGFEFDPYPLIWQRGINAGIAPDSNKRPRRIYETAFFGWRNGRDILGTKANSIVAPLDRTRHPHEKSEIALRHFFEMCVDANTRLLDPTCGSGSALRAAKSLGANTVLGLESNPEYAADARKAFGQSSGNV